MNERLGRHYLWAVFISAINMPGTRFVNNIVYAGVGLTGALFALAGSLTVGQLTIFLCYASQSSKPFNEISEVIAELQNALACAGRVFEFLAEEEETAIDHHGQLQADDGDVRFEQVHFSYHQDIRLIEDLNLAIKPGQRVAIVGPTGSGKTTLINLLMRFYDVDKGQILIDGGDISELKRSDLRSSFGMVLQDTWLRGGSVRENIALGKPDASEEEILAAAQATHVDNFVRRLPQGYETIVGTDNDSLSQGEKQLLCITRVMLSLPPLLILDEATSSIDTRTEQKIQHSFALMMKNRTSFIVAHRLSTIRHADVILVMKDGRIIEQGGHEELMRAQGFYQQLYNAQAE
jgi:ATP-binding cassette subfamily B protein